MRYPRELVLLSLALLLLPIIVQPGLVRASGPERNALHPTSTQPSVYTSPGAINPSSSDPLRILLYDDDYLLPAANQYSRLALVNLGLPFVQHYQDTNGFFTDLTTNGPWSCVIIDQNDFNFGVSGWNKVNSYLTSGGRAVVAAWDIDKTLDSPVWATMGAKWSYVFFSPTKPVYKWQSSAILSSIPSPFNPTDPGTSYTRNGHGMNALSAATAVAGFTITRSSGQAGIIVRNDRKTILNSFIVADFRSNSGADAVRLWQNEISYDCLAPQSVMNVNLLLRTYKTVNVQVQILVGSILVATNTVTLTYAAPTRQVPFTLTTGTSYTVQISGYSIATQTQTATPPTTLTFYIN